MKHTVLDSSNIDAIVADATGQPLEPPKDEKPKVEVKEELKPDEEGDDGLTPQQRAEWTDSMKKTIGKKHRQAKEAEEFAQETYAREQLANKRAAELERELNRLKAQYEAPEQPKGLEEPKRDSFQSDLEYQNAMIDYRVAVKLAEREMEQHKQALEERKKEIETAAIARVNKARELIPDYDDVVGNADVPVPPEIGIYMQESDMFAELGYYFAKNPQVLENLGKLNPHRQLVEIGKIESKLKPFSEKSEKVTNGEKPSLNGKQETATPSSNAKASKAPAPIKPLDMGSAAQVEKPENEMSYLEARAAWAKRNRANLEKRKRH